MTLLLHSPRDLVDFVVEYFDAVQIIEAYRGHTGGWLLGHLVLTHHYYHIGQAFGVRAMHGVENPW